MIDSPEYTTLFLVSSLIEFLTDYTISGELLLDVQATVIRGT